VRWLAHEELICLFYLALYDIPRGLLRRRLCWCFFGSQYSWRCIRHRETFRLSDTAVVELMFAVYAQRRRRSRHTTLQLLRRSRLPSSHGFPATTEATLYTTFCGQYTQTCVDPRFCQNVPSRLQLFALIVPNKPINIIITTVYFIRHKCRSCYHWHV